MEAIPKFDIKSVIKSDIKFDISIKLTTWIGHMVEISHTESEREVLHDCCTLLMMHDLWSVE